MKKEVKFEPELHSVNSFRGLSANSGLSDEDLDAITTQLSSIYNAQTLTERLDRFLSLIELLSPKELNSAACILLYQCYDFVRLILGVATREEIPAHLAHRALRTPFEPNFVANAPRDAQLRWLQDALVDWRQEKNAEEAETKFRAIALASSYKRNTPITVRQQKKRTEREMFLALSVAHNLTHTFVYGTSKLPNEDYQQHEYETGIREASAAELLEKEAFPMGGQLYQIHQAGSDHDRRFKVSCLSTEDCDYDEASFVVTISGRIYVEKSGVIGSRFARNPFFAGRFSVEKGRLKYYDNFSECFAHDERNLVCVTRYFYDLGFIGKHNPHVIAGLARQRETIGETTAFLRYARTFDAFALWQANENLFSLRKGEVFLPSKEALVKLESAAIADQKEQLEALRIREQNAGHVPAWLEHWEDDLENPRHTFPPLVDHLNTDAVNLHGFLAATEKRSETDHRAAEDERAAGIHNDFDRGKLKKEREDGCKKLHELRRIIKLKDRLDSKKLECRFLERRPNTDEIEYGVIYFYPYHNSDTHCSYCILVDEKNRLIHESQVAFISNDETNAVRENLRKYFKPKPNEKRPVFSYKEQKTLKELVLKMQRFERYLMTSPDKLPHDSAVKMNAIKTHVQANVSVNVAMAFCDELRIFDRRRQVNNLCYGKMCLFHTNRGDESAVTHPFDPTKKNYRVNVKILPINHYDQRDWETPMEAEDEHTPFNIRPFSRQAAYWK